MTLYQRVAYLTPSGAQEVTPSAGVGVGLGSGLLVTPRPFTYNTYGGHGVYDLINEGLICFLANDGSPPWGTPYSDGGFRIITKPDGTMSPLRLMEAVASLCSYGTFDEVLSPVNMAQQAKTRLLELRCEPTIELAKYLASLVGLTNRRVHLMNVTQPNFFDDGHVAIEVMEGSQWVFYDVAGDKSFQDDTGEALSLWEVIETGVVDCYPVRLAPARVGRAYEGWVAPFYEMYFRSGSQLLAWQKRIYEVPGITVATGIHWGLPHHLATYKDFVENYPGTNGRWTTSPWEEWVETHYALTNGAD